MKKLLAAFFCISLFYACTEAGEGSEVNKDSTGVNKDTMTQVGTGTATSKDTASYERQSSTATGDSTRH
ncbi:MAG: hypothetical protein EOO04_28005 [Chitinophagaceae bacterium]|nr:MAG: hypothetical protein EOO04_28005 [Chitinophagaceae bacterium]